MYGLGKGYFHNITFMCILYKNTLYDNHKDPHSNTNCIKFKRVH